MLPCSDMQKDHLSRSPEKICLQQRASPLQAQVYMSGLQEDGSWSVSLGYDQTCLRTWAQSRCCCRVDIDEFQEVAAVAGVTAMPTFQFFKASKKIAELKGANAAELEKLIKQHQGPVEDAASGSASSVLVAGQSEIADQITLNQVDCLNQQTANHIRNALKADKTYLESDVDEQLIISVPFNQSVKLHSIKIAPKDIAHAPKTIKLYVNKLTLGFEDADSVEETQTVVLSEKDYEGNGLISLRFVKF